MYTRTLQEHSPPSQFNNTVTGRSHANRHIKFVNAAAISRTAEKALNELLADRNNWPSNLLQQSGTPWGKRGVTKPLAEKVFHYVEKHYLAGYAKSGNSQYTHNLCKNVYRSIAGRPDGAKVTKKEQKKVGACLGYLAALGVLEYVPGTGVKGAYVGYGYAVLGTTAPVLAPVKPIKGGAPKSNQKETDLGAPITGSYYRDKTLERVEEIKEKETATPAQHSNAERLLNEIASRLKKVAKGQPVGAVLLNAGTKHVGLIKALTLTGQVCADALNAGVTNAYALVAKEVLQNGDLTRADNPPALLASIIHRDYQKHAYLLASRAGRYNPELQQINERAEMVHDAISLTNKNGPGREHWRTKARQHLGQNVAASHVDGYATVQPDTATLEGIEQATAVTELTPAYLTEPPLRGRIVADAVRQAKHLGGLTGDTAERIHAKYLDRRAAGTLWAETDLAGLEQELGRPLHLAECALYDLAVSVSAAAWERAEAGAGEPVAVHNAVLV